MFVIDSGLTDALERLARSCQVTMSALMQTIWGVLVNITGVPMTLCSVRSYPVGRLQFRDVEHMVGLFINAVPVRVRTQGTMTFKQLCKEMHRQAATAEEFSFMPLAEIQAAAGVGRCSIICSSMKTTRPVRTYSMWKRMGLIFTSVRSKPMNIRTMILNVSIGPGENMLVKFNYNTRVYDEAFVRKNVCPSGANMP